MANKISTTPVMLGIKPSFGSIGQETEWVSDESKIKTWAEIKCLWDFLSEEDKRKPQLLSCPCPKCTVRF